MMPHGEPPQRPNQAYQSKAILQDIVIENGYISFSLSRGWDMQRKLYELRILFPQASIRQNQWKIANSPNNRKKLIALFPHIEDDLQNTDHQPPLL